MLSSYLHFTYSISFYLHLLAATIGQIALQQITKVTVGKKHVFLMQNGFRLLLVPISAGCCNISVYVIWRSNIASSILGQWATNSNLLVQLFPFHVSYSVQLRFKSSILSMMYKRSLFNLCYSILRIMILGSRRSFFCSYHNLSFCKAQ